MVSRLQQWILVLTSLATACSGERVATGIYNVSSNCRGATQSGTLDLRQSTTYSTSSYDYDVPGSAEFGFPNDKWTRDASLLNSTGSDRSCVAVVAGEKVAKAAFICRETSTDEAICSIVVRK